jgi:flagellar hook-associated protein 3 FlgL
MRISLLQGFNQGVSGILRLQERTFVTQEQISSGTRLNAPSDDPVGSTEALRVDQDQSRLNQYVKNIDMADGRISLQDTQMGQVNEILVRVRELAILAGDGALGAIERQGMALELEEILDTLVDIGNTRDATGEYVFAGYQGDVKPVVQSSSGEFIYAADEGVRSIQTSSTTTTIIGDNGKDIFFDIPTANKTFNTVAEASNAGTAVVVERRVTDQANYDTNSYPSDYVVRYDGGLNNYEVFDRADYEVNGPAGTVLFATPANLTGDTVLDANAPGIDLGWEITMRGVPTDGDIYTVNSSESQSLFETVRKLQNDVQRAGNTDAEEQQLIADIAEALDNLNFAETHTSQVRSEFGARLNANDSSKQVHTGVALVNQEVLSDIRDLDYAEAISRLSMETFTLEAAQQSYAKVSGLSLFNFIR